MRRSSNLKLHFRHHGSPDSTPYRVCCNVVDVCINQELLDAIRQNRLTGDGIIVRLHWETKNKQYSDKSLSTITIYQGDKSKTTLNPQYAVAVATRTDILDKFASDMLDVYDARLVAVSYAPFALIFLQSVDFEVSMFTSEKYKLYGILRNFVSECVPSENRIQLSFRINKGSKVQLPQSGICRCLVPSSEDVLHRDHQTREASCQTVAVPFSSSTSSRLGDKKNLEDSTHRMIGERFAAIAKELTDQHNSMDSQLHEHRKQTQEMKVLLLDITEAIAKKTDDETIITAENNLEDNPNLIQSLLESDEQIISAHSATKRNDNFVASEHLNIDENDDNDDDNDDAMNAYDDMNINGTKDNDQLISEELEYDRGKMEEKVKTEGRVHQQITIRKGSILKEDEETELRSLSPGKTKDEMTQKSTKENRLFLSQFSRSFTSPQPRLSNGRESKLQSRQTTIRGQTMSDVSHAHGRYSKRSVSDLNGEFWYDSYQKQDGKVDTVTESKSQIGPNGKYVTTQTTKATLTRPDGKVETARLLANQFGNLDDLRMNSMMHDKHSHKRNTYSEVQSAGLNLDIGTRLPTSDRVSVMTKTRLSDEEGGKDRFRLLIDCMIGDNPNKDKLWETVDDILSEEKTFVPYVDAVLDTVICLDTSDSVKGETFQEIKKSVTDFINGIEDLAEHYQLEENIAIVTFGGHVKIVHHLTNDYGSLRDAMDEITPGGPSPMLEGVLVSIACMNEGGELGISDFLRLPPRLIIITDCLATGMLPETADDNKYGIDEQQKILLENAFETLRKRQPGDFQHGQITFVPVGNCNRNLLLYLAKSCGGSVMEKSNLTKLCKHQRFHKLAGEAMGRMSRKNYETAKVTYGTVTLNAELGLDVEANEMIQVRAIVQEHLGKVLIQYGSIYKFDNIHEIPGLPPLGSRVTRGQDWIWGNQDTRGAGTIFNHGLDGQYIWVLWDNAMCNVYRFGRNGIYDVQVVNNRPRQPKQIDFSVGLQVERGPNWHVLYGNQDGGPGNRGVIVRERPEQGRVMVRWQNGKMYEYRNGEDNMFDLTVLDPLALLLDIKQNHNLK